MKSAIVELADISKDYMGLRPLRIERLSIAAGEPVAIVGLDSAAAEVFINLLTGSTLPDRGDVQVFGRPTASITDSAEWLAFVDRFGIVSDRAVLLDGLSVIQNLAVPFTLEIEPPSEEVSRRAVLLAAEVGLSDDVLTRAVGDLDGAARARVRLARALALDPAILLVEHASAGVPPDQVAALGAQIRSVAARRGAAVVAATADPAFARAVAKRVLTLEAATGKLKRRYLF